MQQVLKQAVEQMVRLGNMLNWNLPVDREYVNALNDLRALRDATQPSVQRTACRLGENPIHVGPFLATPEGKSKCDACGEEW